MTAKSMYSRPKKIKSSEQRSKISFRFNDPHFVSVIEGNCWYRCIKDNVGTIIWSLILKDYYCHTKYFGL